MEESMTGKVTWRDLHEATQKDLKRIYRVDSRGLENQVRRHLDGANATERRQVYQQFYSRKEK
jgi:hypothetical protein